MASGIHLYSEVGRLERVMLHRPGRELENLTPVNMQKLLFDDVPDAVLAAEEHDHFAEVLRRVGAEVLYVEDMLAEILADEAIRRKFLTHFLTEAKVYRDQCPMLLDFLMAQDDLKKLVGMLIAGLRREEFSPSEFYLSKFDHTDLLWFDPMPNLYFMRDPLSALGYGVSVNCMWTETRQRETLLFDYLLAYHPVFAEATAYYGRNDNATIEGGDILVLSPRVVAIGVSQRTEATAVERLTRNLLSDERNTFEHVLVFMIPRRRAFMHLDTVFTMIDRDIFTIHPEVEDMLEVYDLTLDRNGEIRIERRDAVLEKVLSKALGLSETAIIRCGGTSLIDAQREQWNDGSNTLAVAPGEVVVYARNRVTNRLLEEAGVKLYEIPSSELSRGRGGPRCMTMPLRRAAVD